MIWEMTRETEGLPTVVRERGSWEEDTDSEPRRDAECTPLRSARSDGGYQVGGVLGVWRVAGVEAVSGRGLWAGEGGLL